MIAAKTILQRLNDPPQVVIFPLPPESGEIVVLYLRVTV